MLNYECSLQMLNLEIFTCICIFLTSARSVSCNDNFVRDLHMRQKLTLKNRIVEVGYLWKGNVRHRIQCPEKCLVYTACKSVFYNTDTKICTVHDQIFEDIVETTSSLKTIYYVIEEGQRPDLQSCQDLKNCNGDYSDGEYWLYPQANNYTKTKIYCHDMTNDPQEYVTLYGLNEGTRSVRAITSTNPCAWRTGIFTRSVFSKIRLNITTMAVIRSDKRFAVLTIDPTNTWDTPDFAFGLGCSIYNLGSCTKTGYFRIDTSNTGLKVSPNVNYKLQGWQPKWGPIITSADNHVTEVRCDGGCGYCLPDGELILVNADDEAASDSATYPQCKRK